MFFRKTVPVALLAASVFAISTPMALAAGKGEMFMGQFTTEHGTTSHPMGDVHARLNPTTHELTYSIHWSGLTGDVNAAHFHGPAAADQEAGVLVPIDGPYTSPLKGKVQLDSQQAAELEAGQVYVNLHTQAYPNGEARAQLIKH
ncbi:CHRD domain-containing protein [Acetobacter conturbans]|uniref:CHRD domain-containing protein n=1 Tax=Acetobacter conturbans TaxID=1737472 RepID=A0ABX0JYD1_9PROT|nr:CHRD domain-containing protein [Acetobacter conturbans]NHN88331.1 CHRD domain-containing protein [Acetobacter conturbans]